MPVYQHKGTAYGQVCWAASDPPEGALVCCTWLFPGDVSATALAATVPVVPKDAGVGNTPLFATERGLADVAQSKNSAAG